MDLFVKCHLKLHTDIILQLLFKPQILHFLTAIFFTFWQQKNYNLIHHPSFSVAAPNKWNHLPTELKTRMFNCFFQ